MKNLCLHCGEREQMDADMLCSVCADYPKCEGCQVIFGIGICKPSMENPNRCDSCLDFEDNIAFFCKGCHKRLPLFYSPNTNTLHIVVRGNWCGNCNNACAIEARRARDREETPEYIGYLGILAKQLLMGVVSQGAFDEAREMNPHDITRQPAKTTE